MSLTSFLSKVFGDKSSRDRKQLQPIVDKINALGPEMKALDNDGLRARIDAVRADIANAISNDEKAIAEIRAKVETLPYDQRQPLWDDIDKHEKNIIDTIEDQLDKHLVEVFACLRETASRFANNEEVVVTATQMDRDLAAQGRDFVSIDGDKAIWKNHWMAGGNEITWDMVHYDVQLMGGVVLTQGKIAEMAPDGSGVSYDMLLPLSVFVFLWVNDSGAYCAGSLLGKHKLFPRISPGKTWEGSIGGGILVIIVAATTTIMEPEILRGLSATVSAKEMQLLYDGSVWPAGDGGSLSAANCLPLLLYAAGEGFVTREGADKIGGEEYIFLATEASGSDGEKFACTLWVQPETFAPYAAELSRDGQVLLTVTFTQFACERDTQEK